jgi:hypothetical protein
MATTATPTLTAGPATIAGLGIKATFELVCDTTDAAGELTLDLTSWFSYVHGITVCGSDGAVGYVAEIQMPAPGTAISSTSVLVGIYESGTAGAALDSVDSTDVSGYIPGLTIEVTGRAAIPTSWA